jgi:hypothetical protein
LFELLDFKEFQEVFNQVQQSRLETLQASHEQSEAFYITKDQMLTEQFAKLQFTTDRKIGDQRGLQNSIQALFLTAIQQLQ